MTETAPELRRRLATILAVDLAGFSARAEEDAAPAVRAVAALDAQVRGVAQARGGRLFSTAGDGFMLEFSAAESAVEAALDLLTALPEDAPVRIGGHLGDVVENGAHDLLGHGVNVASRLQKEAAIGTAAFSGAVFDAVRGPLAMRLVRRGRLTLDKLRAPIEVFVLDPKSPPGKARWRRRQAPIVLVAASVAFVLMAGVFILQQAGVIGPDRRAVAAQMASDPEMVKALAERVTLRLVGGDGRSSSGVSDAVFALGASGVPRERQAFSLLVDGDGANALKVLEDFAAELEAQGQKDAAAAAYTRIGAIALYIDQGRGIAARRRALALAPESMTALQGLVLDVFLLQDAVPAFAIVDEALQRPNASQRFIAFAHLMRSIIETDGPGDITASRKSIATAQAIQARIKDPVIAAAIPWAAAVADVFEERLPQALRAAELSVRLSAALPGDAPHNGEIMLSRVQYAMGDWTAAYAASSATLDRRRRTGDFIPAPTLIVACNAALNLHRPDDAAPYCNAVAQRTDQSGGVIANTLLARLAATRGDVATARANLAAAQALRPPTPGRGVPEFDTTAAFIDVAAGDLSAAEKHIEDAVAAADSGGRGMRDSRGVRATRSYRAGLLRLLGAWLVAGGESKRACAYLGRSRALYREIGATPGVTAVEALRAEARCRT